MTKALLAIFLLTVSSAFGGLISATYSGTTYTEIYPNLDTPGYFGTEGANLWGKAITVGFSYDPQACSDSADATSEELSNCTVGSASAFVTIDGITISATNSAAPGYAQFDSFGNGQFSMLAFDSDHIVNLILQGPSHIATDTLLTGPPGFNPSGDFQVNFGTGGYQHQDIIHFTNVTSIEAEAPEPSTFILFGGAVVGGLIRQRRRVLR